MAKLDEWLKTFTISSSIDGLYWVDLSTDLLDPDQYEENADHPFCFAVEIGDSWAKFEFLIRSRPNMKSQHIRYANSRQQEYILNFSRRLIEDLNLRT